jgi:long-chain acyl-CoA synthetase
MSYMAGILNLVVSPFMAGAAIVIGPEFSARTALDFWSLPTRESVNALWLTPTIAAMLLRLDRHQLSSGNALGIVRAFVGTAALPVETKSAFESRYGFALAPSYGTSELLLLTVALPELHEPEDSVGRPLPEVELRVADGDDGTGEIAVRTPFHFRGYLGGEDARDGEWHLTGDVGRSNPDGTLVLTGRKKELIICGGVNVSPAAVERVMEQHPAVEAVAAVGIPDPVLGEVVGLAVKLRHGRSLESIRDELAAHARNGLMAAQRPVHIVAVDELPRTTTGKLQRLRAREVVLRQMGR